MRHRRSTRMPGRFPRTDAIVSNSLRDQLLKVGLVDEEKVKAVERGEKQQKRAKSKKAKRKPKAERRAQAAARHARSGARQDPTAGPWPSLPSQLRDNGF